MTLRTLADAMAAGELSELEPITAIYQGRRRTLRRFSDGVDVLDMGPDGYVRSPRTPRRFVSPRELIDVRASNMPELAALRWACSGVWSQFVWRARATREIDISLRTELLGVSITRKAQLGSLGSEFVDEVAFSLSVALGVEAVENLTRAQRRRRDIRLTIIRDEIGVLQSAPRPSCMPVHQVLAGMGESLSRAMKTAGKPRDFLP